MSQNRGIGLAICQLITSQPALGSIQLVATTRRGDDLKLSAAQKGCEVSYAALDIGSPESIEAFAKHLALKHDGADILINNAGINLDSQDNDDAVQRTLDINYRGTLQVRFCFATSFSLAPSMHNPVSLFPRIWRENESDLVASRCARACYHS